MRSEQLIPLRKIRDDYIDVTPMTVWRWLQRDLFPQPASTINAVRYWRRSDIERWLIARELLGDPAAKAKAGRLEILRGELSARREEYQEGSAE